MTFDFRAKGAAFVESSSNENFPLISVNGEVQIGTCLTMAIRKSVRPRVLGRGKNQMNAEGQI